MSEQGDKARKALHDMRWGPHIDDPVERQEIMDDAIKIALGTVAALEADNAALRKRVEELKGALRAGPAAIPNTWLDPLLTGPNAAFDKNSPEESVQAILKEILKCAAS
jgi:hypothetical protein